MTPIRAAIRVFDATVDLVIPALDAVLRREGYVPFPADRVPPAYPADPREFSRVWLDADEPSATVTLQPEAWRRAFAWTLALARTLESSRLAVAVRPPGEALRVKAYSGGDLVLAVGEDDDEELFYRPRRADAAAIGRLLAEWAVAPAAGPDPESVWRGLGPGYPGVAGERANPSGTARLYVRADSRLVVEG